MRHAVQFYAFRSARRAGVGLFVTCLVDMIRPRIGFAAIELLHRAGCKVVVPRAQTCCGQPAFNSGDRGHARAIAKTVVKTFEEFDYVVAPSGSCAATIKVHYPELFAEDAGWRKRAEDLPARTFELLSFLVDVRSFRPGDISLRASATYHDSCSGLRELGVKAQPRLLLEAIEGLNLIPLPGLTSAVVSAGRFASNILRSPTRSSMTKRAPSKASRPIFCSAAISAAL
ncbi:protein of unknown function [Methylocella tundrae]|uniref:Cysteine-rich domain-containing protein n=1 Tax=Methylocella tundrae TaxID=227605 RepID=A0A4U8Z3H7_METTU|nr:protein of unknown function [Methylocella tundrae]